MPEELNLENLGIQQTQTQVDQSQQQPEPTYGNQFLQTVAEQDRAIVEKYISEWDKGLTQKFQEHAEKLKPWEELGTDYDSVVDALQIMKFAEQDPVGFYREVQAQLKELGHMPDEIELGQGGNGNQQQQVTNLPEFEGLPPQFVQKFQALEGELQDLRKFKEDSVGEREKATNQQKLDKLLETLETTHGKFDHQAVLARIMDGMKPDEAVKDFQKVLKEFSTPQRQTPPPIVGGGRVPAEQVDSSAMRDKNKRKSLVADRLAALAE